MTGQFREQQVMRMVRLTHRQLQWLRYNGYIRPGKGPLSPGSKGGRFVYLYTRQQVLEILLMRELRYRCAMRFSPVKRLLKRILRDVDPSTELLAVSHLTKVQYRCFEYSEYERAVWWAAHQDGPVSVIDIGKLHQRAYEA